MSSSFTIPGLGQAKPNETLPASSFAPDIMAVAASIGGDIDGETKESSSKGVDQDMRKEASGEAQQHPSASPAGDAAGVQPSTDGDRMEVDQLDEDKIEPTAAVASEEGQSRSGPPGSPSVTHALEAVLDGLLGATSATEQEPAEARVEAAAADVQNGDEETHPEWEADSSPYVSSDSDSSDDSSSEDDSSEDESKLMGIEETVRMLMEADAGSDDEADGSKIAKQAAGVRTKNELPDEPDERPSIVIPADDEILPLGTVKHIVEGTQVLVEALTGVVAPTILDRGSVLCKEDRTVLGVIHDTIATVHRPMYLMSFRSEEEIQGAGVQTDLQIWYPKSHAKYVFPAQLRQEKGSDASNLHDEEVGPDEMEYSDDEAEQAHKREKKGRKRGKGGRNKDDSENTRRNGFTDNAGNADQPLNYDEDEDGPYKPLARPANFGRGQSLAAPSHGNPPNNNARGGGSFRGQRGDSRGRGGRGRGFGGRGRGGNHHGHPHSNGSSDGYALPPRPYMPQSPYNATSPPSYPPVPPPPPQYAGPQTGVPPPPFPPLPGSFNFHVPGWNQGQAQPSPYTPQMPPAPYPSYAPPPAGTYGTPAHGAHGQPGQTSPPSGYYGSPAYGGQPPNGQQRWS